MKAPLILAIDQGTTSSRAILYDADMQPIAKGQHTLTQHYPRSGWVEHDAEEIWTTVLHAVRDALRSARVTAADIAAIGITNQRETSVMWEKASGRPVHNAIVWQDRRTAATCRKLVATGAERGVSRRTGLLIDPYFSATKFAWLLDHVPGARRRAAKGELLAGTVDSWLIWRLTGGRVHATDATNASRTLLYDIRRNCWDDTLLDLFKVPGSILPEVRDCAAEFGNTDPAVLGASIPILGVAGDQQAATIGQGCFQLGMVKATYGTGCFVLLNTGLDLVRSRNRLLSTIAYRLDGETTYALEGSIFNAGSTVQWLRDELGIIESAQQSGELAAQADAAQQVYFVPAFTGLGAPHWDPNARGAIFGLTRSTRPNELARAALDSVVLQTHDLLAAMRRDRGAASASVTALRVDGGMAVSDWTMQRLADVLDTTIERSVDPETTARGAAWLAGWKLGVYPLFDVKKDARAGMQFFKPSMGDRERRGLLLGWRNAVRRTLTNEKGPQKRA